MKKRIMQLLCALMLAFGYVWGQTSSYTSYYEKTIGAYNNMAERNFLLAAELYEEAFSESYPFPDDLANLRDCYLALGDTTRALNCVKRMIACGWQLNETYPVIGRESIENNIGNFDTTQISHLTSIYPTLRLNYLQQIVPSKNAYLERIVLNEIFCQEIRDGEFAKKLSSAVFVQNTYDLCELLKNKDLDRKEVDVWNHSLFLITLVHCAKSVCLTKFKDDTLFSNLMDLLKEEVMKGNLYPDVYASVYDIVYWFNHNKSYYGRQVSVDPKTGIRFCVEIEDVGDVDKRRAEIGLPPVWAFCKKFDITPPVNYQPRQ